MTIAHVALPVAVAQPFDYWVPDGLDLTRGSVVRVRLGPRTLAGVVVDVTDRGALARERLQPIVERIDLPPLPDDVMELLSFVATYYQDSIGLAFALALPPLRGTGSSPASRAFPPLRLDPSMRGTIEARAARSRFARSLLAKFNAGDCMEPAEIASLDVGERRVLRRWWKEGWLVTRVADPTRAAELNDAQRRAAAAIVDAAGTFTPVLLDGVTGSGKTEVYLSAIARACAEGRQVLLLVPEINLTPQLYARIVAALPRTHVVTLHSGLAAGARRASWLAATRGDADLVLGTRLSIFTPLPRLGLIVVDEEHDASYKQHDGVRYHARDVAIWRAKRRAVPVVLGSATPSLESWLHAKSGRYTRLVLDRRADPRAAPPRVTLVPASGDHVHEGMSSQLWHALRERLARGEQSLVFVNRRGFAPSLKCVSCGWEAGCARCTARLTLHRTPPSLRCHHCGHEEPVPNACPSCGNVDLLPRGHGTQRLERALHEGLAGARIARVDRDTTRRRSAFDDVRRSVEANEVDVLLGTQMLAKGHDFPRLTLVGVLGADNALFSADFRATERLAALLMQVAGRAGRAALAGEVIVQTDFPRHPVYCALCENDYGAFADRLLVEREAAGLPPFARLALLTAEAHQRSDVDAFLADAWDRARRLAPSDGVEVFAPVEAAMARRAGFERGQMLLRSQSATSLSRALTALRGALGDAPRRVRWTIDVDPDAVA